MSSHHKQRFFNLHHDQVNAGHLRKMERQAARLQRFLTGREEAQLEYRWMQIFGFICFAYMQFATVAYMWYIL